MIHVATTSYDKELGEYCSTGMDISFGPLNIGWLPGKAYDVPCEPSLSGYIHGALEGEAGFDIPEMCQGEILLDPKIPVELPCKTWVNRDTCRDSIMIVWPLHKFVCWIGDSGWQHPSPQVAHEKHSHHSAESRRVVQKFRFLVVGVDDVESIKYARECADYRRDML